MNAIGQDDFWQEQADEPEIRIDGRVRPDLEDAYWQTAYRAQPYYQAGYSFDEYAPAFCVGYIGYAQYGGRFDEAEKSLCANWVRIKGDSRLTLDDAMQAIRAAWEHASAVPAHIEQDVEELVPAEFIAAQGRARQSSNYATA